MTNRLMLRRPSALASAWFFFILLLVAPVHPTIGETIQLERRDGLYMVPVRINEAVNLPFFLDSGSTVVVIPQDVFSTLLRTGTVKKSDFIGPGKITLADGSEQLSQLFTLHEVRVGDHVVRNVVAKCGSGQRRSTTWPKLPLEIACVVDRQPAACPCL
jgi:predicted aspartyl protease